MPKRSTASTKTPTRKTPASASSRTSELWEKYCETPAADLLRVYADALVEDGDPRGQFLQLCLVDKPTPEQTAAKAGMLTKLTKKVLAGPGGEYLRELEFGPNGLVARARVELGSVLEHIDVISRINPRLVLTITSLKTLKQARELANVALGGVYFVDFSCITGAVDGLSLNDKELEALAPALENVRHLQLPCRGEKHFTPAGLRALGRHLKQLRYLAFDYDGDPYYPGAKHPAPAAEYGRAIAETPGFETLRGLDLEGLGVGDLPRRSLVLDAGLLKGGKLTPKALAGIEGGIELVDQLDAALA